MAKRKASINPAKLSVAELARVLSQTSGETITQEQIKEDVQAGAPVNPDGTIHLVHYAAWLASQIKQAGSRPAVTRRSPNHITLSESAPHG